MILPTILRPLCYCIVGIASWGGLAAVRSVAGPWDADVHWKLACIALLLASGMVGACLAGLMLTSAQQPVAMALSALALPAAWAMLAAGLDRRLASRHG